ncbi:MAG: hypothetical protein IPP58_08970 [Holophagaceae bacterium]|uniref:Outer membrane protein beta-barrel domain-containing protein n=1 Tax=Candidatus Geothrix skivensis TaxID=2954439 RepID=A0A9D7SHJ5_9BACT|nr:hypothetical protein [Candidatus Geothrix skivensis]
MLIRHLATCTAFAASLTAQEGTPAFQWVGVRGGSMSFDPQEYVKAAPILGAQGGMVFAGQRYGISLEVLSTGPESTLVLNRKVNHSLVSATWMTGLAGEASDRFWPYFGLGLGGATVVKIAHPTKTITTSMAPAAHASLGLVHRPLRGLIWGVEGRYLVTFSNPGMNEYHGTVLLGFSWGGQRTTRRTEAPLPAPVPVPVVAAPPPPPPVPMVVTAPPSPPPAAAPPRPSQAPILVVEAPPPQVPPAPSTVAAPPPARVAPTPAPRSLPVASSQPDASRQERLEALRREDISRSLELGRRRLQAIPCRSLDRPPGSGQPQLHPEERSRGLPRGEPDLFVAPIQLQGGKTAYQLFLGAYPRRPPPSGRPRRFRPSSWKGATGPRPSPSQEFQ